LLIVIIENRFFVVRINQPISQNAKKTKQNATEKQKAGSYRKAEKSALTAVYKSNNKTPKKRIVKQT